MSPENSPVCLSAALLQQFVLLAREEIGIENLALVLSAVNLTPAMLDKDAISCLNRQELVETYALSQHAVRQYFGRGARGMLLRIGRQLWHRMQKRSPLREWISRTWLRCLPLAPRRRRSLEMVAAYLRGPGAMVSVHLMDTDLLLVDRSAAATYRQHADAPICYVTLGLIQGALCWATGHESDVEEVACRAVGAAACEFKVKSGGR